MAEIRNTFKTMVGDPEGKKPLGTRDVSRRIILKWVFIKIG
jgi:hypothetical protein